MRRSLWVQCDGRDSTVARPFRAPPTTFRYGPTMTTMNYRRLGASGLKVSELSFGSWVTYGNQMGADVARECMAAAYDAGVNFFDNAEVYAKGESETIMGEALQQARLAPLVLHRLDQVLLGPARRPEREEHAQPQVPDAGDRRVARAASSLDYVDLVFCHRADPDTPIEETVLRDARHDRRRQGALLGHVGVERRRDHGGVADRRPPPPAQAGDGAAAVQPAAPRARREGIRAALRATSASARRSGARSRRACSPASTTTASRRTRAARSRATNGSPSGCPTRRRSRSCKRLAPIAADLGCTLAQMSLAWCLKNPHVSTVITGASRPAQVRREHEGARRRGRSSRRT